MRHFRWHRDVLTLHCSIQINTRTSRIIGVHDSQLNITIAAPAREGAANSALIEQLARKFAVAKSRITLQRGDLAPPATRL
ncbi:MAG TPA: YggU family protein [Porticoccaceae bacterium]|nr:YggU family protein [Porticoccaceae bacterium]